MRAWIIAALLLAPAPAAAAPGDAASVRAFLQSIDADYGKGGTGAPMQRPERWFEPQLAAAIRKDNAEADKRGDVSKLDADPFCDCQDFDVLRAAVDNVTVTDGKTATASVSFDNGGPVSMRYELVRTRNGWRVFDIHWEEGDLRAMYFPPAG
jgi:hypothetical protein